MAKSDFWLSIYSVVLLNTEESDNKSTESSKTENDLKAIG